MKTKPLPLLFALCGAIFLTSCSTPVGKTTFPQAETTFTPKETYSTNMDGLWNATLSALEKNRITTVSTSKESGVIQTDYIAGQSRMIGGFLSAQSTRYKYNITVRKLSEGETKLVIISKLESSINNGQSATPWTDVSGQNPKFTKNLENWLYGEIEKELPQTGGAK